MHFLKEGQKIRAWVDPPPIIWAMPERKRFFSMDLFPYSPYPPRGMASSGWNRRGERLVVTPDLYEGRSRIR